MLAGYYRRDYRTETFKLEGPRTCKLPQAIRDVLRSPCTSCVHKGPQFIWPLLKTPGTVLYGASQALGLQQGQTVGLKSKSESTRTQLKDMETSEFGHHFLIEIKGSELESFERDLISELCPLGIVLRSENFAHSSNYPDVMAKYAALLGEVQALCGRDKLIVAAHADANYGFQRPAPFTNFSSAASYVKNSAAAAKIISEESLSAGVNLLIGPNSNVSVPGISPQAEPTEFSSAVDEVTQCACAFVSEAHKAGMLTCAFDFPGEGSASTKGRERKTCGLILQELEHRDVRPFAALIDLKVDAIRLSDGLYGAVDADYPAFMSSALCAELLRKKLGFSGVAISPEIRVGALEKFYSLPEVMRAAFVAGCDLFHVPDLNFALQLAQHLADVKLIKAAPEAAFDESADRLNRLYEAAQASSIKLLTGKGSAKEI